MHKHIGCRHQVRNIFAMSEPFDAFTDTESLRSLRQIAGDSVGLVQSRNQKLCVVKFGQCLDRSIGALCVGLDTDRKPHPVILGKAHVGAQRMANAICPAGRLPAWPPVQASMWSAFASNACCCDGKNQVTER